MWLDLLRPLGPRLKPNKHSSWAPWENLPLPTGLRVDSRSAFWRCFCGWLHVAHHCFQLHFQRILRHLTASCLHLLLAPITPSQHVCTAQLLGAEWAQKFVSFSYWAIQLWAGHSRPKVKLLCAPPGSAFSDCGWGWGSCWTASNLRHWQFWTLCLHCAQFGVL